MLKAPQLSVQNSGKTAHVWEWPNKRCRKLKIDKGKCKKEGQFCLHFGCLGF